MSERFEARVGAKLNNGATILAVLDKGDGKRLLLSDSSKKDRPEYVTWLVDDEGDCSLGNTFSELGAAAQDLVDRA
jgi:hypothetical protein